MTPLGLPGSETDGAFEELLLKKNGDPKTVQDLFECFVALNHDQKTNWRAMIKEIRSVAECVDSHRTEDVNMTKEQFAEFMVGRDRILKDLEVRIEGRIAESCAERHEAEVKLENEIKAIWQEIRRDPRRSGDDATENWGKSIFGDDQRSWLEVIFAWKTIKWFVAAAVVIALDVVSHQIAGM